MKTINMSCNTFKPLDSANPISPNVFCADPTGVEYEGRLYVYGTNDHQQYETVGVDGTYYYTYCTDWQKRDNWDHTDIPAPPTCSMAYLTTKTPLDGESWKFGGGYFLNAGDSGMDWCNNHTHFIEYRGVNYIINHTMHIQERTKTKGGFRCMCVDYLPYSGEKIPVAMATRKGVEQIRPFDPFAVHSGAEMFTCADMWYEQTDQGKMSAKSLADGSWIYIKGVDFCKGAECITVTVSGKGRICVCLDDDITSCVAALEVNSDISKDITEEFTGAIMGIHNLYFVFFGKDICLERWLVK